MSFLTKTDQIQKLTCRAINSLGCNYNWLQPRLSYPAGIQLGAIAFLENLYPYHPPTT